MGLLKVLEFLKSPGSLLGEIPITGNSAQQGQQKTQACKRHHSAQREHITQIILQLFESPSNSY